MFKPKTDEIKSGDLENWHSELPPDLPSPPDWMTRALNQKRTERSVESQGASLKVYEWGDRGKPSIVLLHGLLAHAKVFAFIAPYLALDYHVVAYDLSGMGDSDAREEHPEA